MTTHPPQSTTTQDGAELGLGAPGKSTPRVPAGYKQTEVGVIPEDWEVMKLHNLSRGGLQNGLFFEPSRKGGKTRIINVGDLYNERAISIFGLERFDARKNEQDRFQVRSGDLFFTRSSIVPKGIAYTNIAILESSGAPIVFDSHLIKLSPNTEFVEPEYLWRVLRADPSRRQLVASAKTATMTTIDQNAILSCVVPLPPTLAEQRAIAEALSDADALIDSLEQLIAKKRLLKQGAMQDLLTGKKRLPGFEGEWEVKKLSELGRCHRGVSYNPAADLSPHETGSTVRLLRSNNVQESQLDFDDMQFVTENRVSPDQYLRQNDILICMANGSKRLVGKAAPCPKLPDKAYTFGAFMGCFRPDPAAADEQFVSGIFYTENYRRHIDLLLAGSSINNLSPGNVESLEVPVPAQKAEQTAIAAILSDMDARIAALEAKLAKARQLKQGMMQELLTGKTRLV